MITDRDLIAFMETPAADADLAARIADDEVAQREVCEQLRLDAALTAFHASPENKQRLRESILAEILPHGARLMAAALDTPPPPHRGARNFTLVVLALLLVGLAIAMFMLPRPGAHGDNGTFGVVLDSPKDAEILRGRSPIGVTQELRVHRGDLIVTRGDELLLGTPDGCVISVGRASHLKLRGTDPRTGGVSCELRRGEVTVAVAEEGVEVITDHARILLRSAKAHILVGADETQVAVAEGEAILARDRDMDVLSISSGQSAVANSHGLKPAEPTATPRRRE